MASQTSLACPLLWMTHPVCRKRLSGSTLAAALKLPAFFAALFHIIAVGGCLGALSQQLPHFVYTNTALNACLTLLLLRLLPCRPIQVSAPSSSDNSQVQQGGSGGRYVGGGFPIGFGTLGGGGFGFPGRRLLMARV